jgi:ribonucleoside-diphosphate reductase alpha chain
MEIIERCMTDPDADDGWNLSTLIAVRFVRQYQRRHCGRKFLNLRMETGEPYIHYIDTSNRMMPEFQKELGLKIHQSNLCSEIILPTNEERTAVCCLSSVNLENYDAWSKDNMFLKDMAEMLDNVLQFFIDNAPDTVSSC